MICSGLCLNPSSPHGSSSPDKAARKGQKQQVPQEEAAAEPLPAAPDTGAQAGKAQDEQSSDDDDDSSSDEER